MSACTQTLNAPPVATSTVEQTVDLTQLVDSPQIGKIVIDFMKKNPTVPYSQEARDGLMKSLTDFFNDAKKNGIIIDFRLQMGEDTNRVVVYIYLLDFAGVHAFARSIP